MAPTAATAAAVLSLLMMVMTLMVASATHGGRHVTDVEEGFEIERRSSSRPGRRHHVVPLTTLTKSLLDHDRRRHVVSRREAPPGGRDWKDVVEKQLNDWRRSVAASNMYYAVCCSSLLTVIKKQGHHHNGGQAARRPYVLSAFTHLGLWRKLYLRLFTASLRIHKMCYETNCSYLHFHQAPAVWLQFEMETFRGSVWGFRPVHVEVEDKAMRQPLSHRLLWVHDRHNGLTLTVLSYLAGPDVVCVRPPMRRTRIRWQLPL